MIVLIADDTETPIPEAALWEAGFTFRIEDNEVGFGFILRDGEGKAIAGTQMQPEAAIGAGLTLIRNALRVLRSSDPKRLSGASLKTKVELELMLAEAARVRTK